MHCTLPQPKRRVKAGNRLGRVRGEGLEEDTSVGESTKSTVHVTKVNAMSCYRASVGTYTCTCTCIYMYIVIYMYRVSHLRTYECVCSAVNGSVVDLPLVPPQ